MGQNTKGRSYSRATTGFHFQVQGCALDSSNPHRIQTD